MQESNDSNDSHIEIEIKPSKVITSDYRLAPLEKRFLPSLRKSIKIAESLSVMTAEQRNTFLNELSDEEIVALEKDWYIWARPAQRLPERSFRIWLIQAGRGFGKTRAGGETIRLWKDMGYRRFALVGITPADARDVMIEGEALALDTVIATPSGWTTMGELRIGDDIFADNGSIVKVIAVSQIWNNRPCYRVTCDMSEPIIADENHKWVVSGLKDRRPDKIRNSGRVSRVLNTKEIKDTLYRRWDMPEYEIPMNKPLQLQSLELPIPPYTLGCWLGDGNNRDSGYTCDPLDIEIIHNIESDGFEVAKNKSAMQWHIHKLTDMLRQNNLLHNKHIPNIYLRSSEHQRLEILQGLMDTDGSITSNNVCEFGNTEKLLVEQVKELLSSLGIKSRDIFEVHPDGYKIVYRLQFMFSDDAPIPFKLSRKVEKCTKRSIQYRGRLIREVELIDSVPTKCIQVSGNGTFLAGKDMVVTHNSGMMEIFPPWDKPEYQASKRRLIWKNGAIALVFSGANPGQLRGPQHEKAWCDEIFAWQYPDETYDNLMMGLRLGDEPQVVITSTPRPLPIIKRIRAMSTTVISRGTTFENRGNLAEAFFGEIISKYEGTRLGLQELHAKILDDNPNALWTRKLIEKTRINLNAMPRLKRIVVAIDPAVTSEEDSCETGIIVAGLGINNEGYILVDASKAMAKPADWATRAVKEYHRWMADKIIGESNNGGEMIEYTIRTIDPKVNYKCVHASKGKFARAEPVSALYEQGRIHHVGTFGLLEDQLCEWELGMDNCDRLDALVWAITELMLQSRLGNYMKAAY